MTRDDSPENSEMDESGGSRSATEREAASDRKTAEHDMKATANPGRKQDSGTADPAQITERISSIGMGSRNHAEKDEDGLESTRLLNIRPPVGSYSPDNKERGDVPSPLPPSKATDVSRAVSSEDRPQEFSGALPAVAGDDDSTRFFQLSVPEHGPIRWEPGSTEHIAEGSGNAGVAVPLSRQQERALERATASAVADSDRASRAAQQGMPPSAIEPYQGKLYALLPELAILNLSLSLLVLLALLWVVFHRSL